MEPRDCIQDKGLEKREVQQWLGKTKPWYVVIVGRSSCLLPMSRNSINPMAYRMSLGDALSAELLGEESAGVVPASHDRCLL